MSRPRLKNWPSLLDAFIESRRNEPFRWGVNDCGLFAADAVRAITGIDPAAAIRGYRTAFGAARLGWMARSEQDPIGVLSLPGRCGMAKIPAAFAGRGDLVSLPMGRAIVIGICLGLKSAGPGPAGVVFVPTALAIEAWRF